MTDKPAPARLTTRDIGLAIRDYLETRDIQRFEERDGELVEATGDDAKQEVVSVDASDPNNLVVELENGQAFIVRIVAR